MLFILESSSIRYLLDELPRSVLPELWEYFEFECDNGDIISDRETQKEAEIELTNSDSLDWIEKHKSIFHTLTQKESIILGDMMQKGFFKSYENDPRLIERKLPEGIPFALSMAKSRNATIVYRKSGKDTKLVIEICRQARINSIEVEDMLLKLKRDFKLAQRQKSET